MKLNASPLPRILFVAAAVFHLSSIIPVVSFSVRHHLQRPVEINSLLGRSSVRLFSTTPLQQQTTLPDEIDQLSVLRGLGPVGGMMRTDYPKVLDTDTVSVAVEAMRIANKGSVLVFDENDNLSGIFTERDFVFKMMDAPNGEKATIVASVMTPRINLIVANSETPINDCVELMTSNKIRHLPILNYRGEAVGIISMRDIIRVLHREDMAKPPPTFFGSSLFEIEEQAKVLANKLSLEAGEESGKQDISRAAFVVAVAVVSAGLLQGSWIHDHEWLSMSLVFLLGYIGIVFENLFEFNKAAIALLMSTALWTIFAGQSHSRLCYIICIKMHCVIHCYILLFYIGLLIDFRTTEN